MIISESLLRELIQQSINEALTNQDRLSLHVKGDLSVDDIEQGVPLYHRPSNSNTGDKYETIKSLMKTGFSREYTGSNGGNMYGPGVYNVYTLRSSNEKAKGYGSFIVRSYLLGGFKDFLIFNINMAKDVYGSDWEIDKQIKKLMPEKLAKEVLSRFGALNARPDTSDGLYRIGRIYMNDNSSLSIKTSSIAVHITDFLGSRIAQTKIRGIIYSGGHDGECAFVRNFSEVIPHSYSEDNGKTWKKGITDELVWRAGHDTDVFATLKGSGLFDDVADRSINGFVIVKKGGKYNYFNVAENDIISKVWFDRAFNFDENGIAEVQYGNNFLKIQYDDIDEEYIVLDKMGEGVCYLNSLPEYINRLQKESYVRNIVDNILNEAKQFQSGDASEREEHFKERFPYMVFHFANDLVKNFQIKGAKVWPIDSTGNYVWITIEKSELSNSVNKKKWEEVVKRIQNKIDNYGKGGDWKYEHIYRENFKAPDGKEYARLLVKKEPVFVGETFDDID